MRVILLTVILIFNGFLFCQNDSFHLDNKSGFIENKGQIHDQFLNPRNDVLFYSQLNGLSLFITESGISYQLMSLTKTESDTEKRTSSPLNYNRIDIAYLNSNSGIEVEKIAGQKSYDNFYLTSCPSGVHGVSTYDSVLLKNIWNGIDILWYIKGGQFEYDLIVHPNAKPEQIQWRIKGAEVSLDKEDNLLMSSSIGEVIEDKPKANQRNREVPIRWFLDENLISMKIGDYNEKDFLVIDPPVVSRYWGSYFGGSGDDEIFSCTSDDVGNIYVAGNTISPTMIATSGSHQDTIYSGLVAFGGDEFLAKFNSDGQRIWATYYGSSSKEVAKACAVDDSLNVYLAGDGFVSPIAPFLSTPNSYKPTPTGGSDVILAKFDSTGKRVWGTYLGGDGSDRLFDMVIDSNANMYLTGLTTDSIIASPGAHQSSFGGGFDDAFLVSMDRNGKRRWGTLYGGSDRDQGNGVAINSNGDIAIAGSSRSPSGIATSNTHKTNAPIKEDAFIALFDKNGSRIWGTYYGESGTFQWETEALDLALTNNRTVYVVGGTQATSGIASTNAYQDSNVASGNTPHAFIASFDSTGQRNWGTYFGEYSMAYSCMIDNSDNIYLTGYGGSGYNMTSLGNIHLGSGSGGDAFISKFNSQGNRVWSSLIGGNGLDQCEDLCFDPNSNIIVAGVTESSNRISQGIVHQPNYSSGKDGFINKLYLCEMDTVSANVNACRSFSSPSGKYVWYENGKYNDTLSNSEGCDSVITFNLQKIVIDTNLSVRFFRFSDNDSILSKEAEGDSYQWYYSNDGCRLDHILINDTNRYITQLKLNVFYSVVIEKNNCFDTSKCFYWNGTGVKELSEQTIQLFPNPSQGRVNLKFQSNINNFSIEIRNSQGKLVDQLTLENTQQFEFDLPEFQGVYFIQVRTEKFSKSFKVIRLKG